MAADPKTQAEIIPEIEPLTLAVSLLCEHPTKLTGLSSTFRQLIVRSLNYFPALRWILFVGAHHPFDYLHDRLRVVREFPGNDVCRARLVADHFSVSERARGLGANLLLTVGFVPLRARLPAVMHLFTLHHLDPANRGRIDRALYRSWAIQNGLRRAELVFTNSRDALARIIQSYPWASPKLRLSYEGLDHDTFSPLPLRGEMRAVRDEFKLPNRYVLFLSNLYPYKQADKLLFAFAAVESARSMQEVCLVFAGGDWNGEAERLRQLARRLGLESRVRFLGWVHDRWIPALLRNAELFVLPSREETFGRSVIEAMACGTPGLVNDLPVLREITGGAAFFTDFDDPATAGQALHRALTDDLARAEIRRLGIAEAARFSFDGLTRERISQLYQLQRQLGTKGQACD